MQDQSLNTRSTIRSDCPPPPGPTDAPLQYSYQPDEDEINLLDLFLVLLKYKWFIASIVTAAGILAVVVSLLMTNIYRSSATIAPQEPEKSPSLPSITGLGAISSFLGLGGNTSLANLQVVLQSRELSQRIIRKYDLLQVLFADVWDAGKKQWLQEPPPTEQDGIALLKDSLLTVSADDAKNVLYVNFDYQDPAFAKLMVERYLTELSETMREEILQGASEKSGFLQQELAKTSDVLMKDKISELLANEIEKMTFARVQKYYNFEVVDPPIVPDANKKIKPKRALICILSVIVAFFVSVFAVFFLEFLRNLKTHADPDQLARLRRYGWGKRTDDG